jgi:endonuclease/exonuclease/phosphatase family metal-dependent hydrolase
MRIARACSDWVAFIIFIVGCSALAQNGTSQSSKRTDLLEAKIMTFNIRYYRAPNDELDAWEYRRSMVADVIENSGADAIGLQEAEFPQVEYLRGKLEDDYGVLATYSDGKLEKHSNALLYLKSRFEVDEQGTFWFSDTPDVPGSKGWGNSSPRFCTWAHFLEKETGKGFYYYNAHLDHKSQGSRDMAAQLITSRIAERTHKDSFVFTGDLNSREDNPVIRFFKGADLLVEDWFCKNPVPMVDSFRVKHGENIAGGTFNGFKNDWDFTKIDYIFTEKSMEIMDAEIITNSVNGHYPSDHFPLTATIRFQ